MTQIWNRWKSLADKIGNFQAGLIFSILFYVVVTPLSVFAKKSDYLRLKVFPIWENSDDNYSSVKKLRGQ